MKTLISKFAVLTAALTLAPTLFAVPLSGTIGFTGRAAYDTASSGTATEVVNWLNPQVNGTGGDFSGLADGTGVNFFSPWMFLTVVPINDFWSVGGFTFQLLSSAVVSQGGTYPSGYVSVNGVGIVSGNGYTPTTLSWSFTSQDPAVTGNPLTFTFSASDISLPASVPDGGITLAFLGSTLVGVNFFRKKFAVAA